MSDKSCLVIKNDGIGDLILASGIIADLSKIFSGNLDLVTCLNNEEIAENLEGVRQCFYVTRDNIFRPNLKRLGILLPVYNNGDHEVFKKLKTTEYDYAICLRRFIRQNSLILMRSTRARNKYCAWQFPTNASKKLMERCTKGWSHYSGDLTVLSELSYLQGFVEEIFKKKIDFYPRLTCFHNEELKPEPKTVGIGLGGCSTRWPIGNWIDLLCRLKQDGWHIFLFGGSDVVECAGWIEKYCKVDKNLVGRLTFKESVPYVNRLSAFIGNDSGFTHFASLVVPKCLVILGGGTFKRFFPWPNSPNQYVIYHALDCFDCVWRCKFSDRYCMQLIPPSDVLKYFYEIIDAAKTERMRNINPSAESYRVGWRSTDRTLPLSFADSTVNQI